MTGFEPQIYGVRSDCSTNCDTSTTQSLCSLGSNVTVLCLSFPTNFSLLLANLFLFHEEESIFRS